MAGGSSSYIAIDYRDTIRKCNRIIELTGGVRSVAGPGCQALRQTCNASWKGSSSKEFDKKTSEVSAKLQKRAKELENMAVNLKKTAQRYQYLEERAREIFS